MLNKFNVLCLFPIKVKNDVVGIHLDHHAACAACDFIQIIDAFYLCLLYYYYCHYLTMNLAHFQQVVLTLNIFLC